MIGGGGPDSCLNSRHFSSVFTRTRVPLRHGSKLRVLGVCTTSIIDIPLLPHAHPARFKGPQNSILWVKEGSKRCWTTKFIFLFYKIYYTQDSIY